MLIKQTSKILSVILLFITLATVVFSQLSAQAVAAPKYFDIDRDNTQFYYYDKKDVIIAVRDGTVAIFEKENGNFNDPALLARYQQKQDFYNNSAVGCESHIDKSNDVGIYGTKSIVFRLYEPEKGTCGDDQYHIGSIDITDADDATIKAAANINWGNEPLGCPGSGKIPNNVNKKDLDYNCPDGGAVINGKYDKDQEIEKPVVGKTSTDSCYEQAGAFGWIICSAAEAVESFTTWFEGQLYSLLHINELPVATDGGIYSTWSSVRTVATTVLVLVALVAIASQIFNFEFISAYTIKKIVPRMVIATILIFTSYYLAAMGIAFVNALGDGVNALIMAPFPDLRDAYNQNNTIQFILTNISGFSTGEGAAATGIIVGAGIAAIGSVGVLGLIVPILLVGGAVLVAFITLVLRKVLILGLIFIMPLAIVAWILPGTQKWFDSWWKLFSRLLLMYPLVIGLLAVGKVAAYLIAMGSDNINSSGAITPIWNMFALNANATVVILMVLVAYFAPYYFIPTMFKSAGSIFGKITSSMQGFGNKYARKAGEASAKKAGDYAASKYKPGASGGRKWIGNTALRLGTGNIMPTQASAAAVAARGVKYEKEKLQNAEFLLGQAERSMSHTEYLAYLESKGDSNSSYNRQAAHNILVKQKGFAELERLREKRGEVEWNKHISVGGTYAEIKSANRTVLQSDAALAIEDGSILDSSDEKREILRKYHQAALTAGYTTITDEDAFRDDLRLQLRDSRQKRTAIHNARHIDKVKILQAMSGDEIISSHDSIYKSQQFDEDGNLITTVNAQGNVVADLEPNSPHMSDTSKDTIRNSELRGRATETAKAELPI